MPVPNIDDVLLKYPPPPPEILNGKVNALYLQWATGLAALKIAKANETIAKFHQATIRGGA